MPFVKKIFSHSKLGNCHDASIVSTPDASNGTKEKTVRFAGHPSERIFPLSDDRNFSLLALIASPQQSMLFQDPTKTNLLPEFTSRIVFCFFTFFSLLMLISYFVHSSFLSKLYASTNLSLQYILLLMGMKLRRNVIFLPENSFLVD